MDNLKQVTSSPNLLVQANLVFLKAKLIAAYEKTATGYKILVKPTSATASAMSIGDMVKEVNGLIQSISGDKPLEEDAIAAQISDLYPASENGSVLDNIKISLKQVFLYVDKTGTDTSQNTFEYAFDVEIINEITKDFDVINLESVSLAIWNTQRESVIAQMDMKKLEELLQEYSE